MSTYPEYLPPHARRVGRRTRLDELLAHVDGSAPVIDVREDLWRAKRIQPVYFKTDSHWSSTGAYLAYRKTMTRIAEDFPNVRPL